MLKTYDETRFGKMLTRVVEHIETSRAAPATSERIAIRSAGGSCSLPFLYSMPSKTNRAVFAEINRRQPIRTAAFFHGVKRSDRPFLVYSVEKLA